MAMSIGFFNGKALAQTDPDVYVKGTEASTIYDMINFYNIEPGNAEFNTTYSYIPYILFASSSTVPSSATRTYAWTTVGGVVSGQNNQETVTVRWNNTKNYNGATPTKSIRLKVTFTWTTTVNNQTQTHTKVIESKRPNGLAEAQPIEVKYISELTSITFAGNTFSNTGTLQYNCGASPQTLSVNAITTDPYSPITLYYTYPQDWTGPATSSGTSVTVTPHIWKEGTIKIEAKRNDSPNFRVRITMNVKRPLPLLGTATGQDKTFCSTSDQLTASANGTNANSFIWNPTGGVTINGSATAVNAAGAVTIKASSYGEYTVRAWSNACQVQSTNYIKYYAYYGPPPVPTGTVNGGPQQTPNVVPNGAFLVLNAPNGQYTYNWAILQGTGYLYPNGGNSANATPNPFIRVEGKLTNVCGSNWTIFYLSSTPMGGFAMAPNPAPADEATIMFEENSAGASLAKSATIYNDKQQKIREFDFSAQKSNNGAKANEFKMNLKGISPGQYYVHVAVGEKVEKQILVIK